MKLYREVKARKRNPESDTWVIAYDVPEEMWPFRVSYSGVWYDMHDKVTDEPQVWLEPIEITEVTRELWKNHCSMGNHGEYMSWDDFVEALSKLKGE